MTEPNGTPEDTGPASPPPVYGPPPAYSPPPAYVPITYEPPPVTSAPPAYGPPSGYSPPPAYVPITYGPPPVTSAPSAYGPPSGYSAPAAYGPPDDQPPPNYYGAYDQPAAPKRSRGKVLLAAVAVAAVVAAGAVVSYIAFGNQHTGAGAATPQKAVAAMVSDLTNSDVLGVFDDLPPAERDALRDSFNDEVTQLKRLKVLDSSANANNVSGVHFHASGLTFSAHDEVINSRARIVSVTGGILTLSTDAGKVPYTKDFLGSAFPTSAPTGATSQTIDLAAEAAKDGGPLRIGTEKVGGSWYPSLMYTIVDAAARDDGHDPAPTAADAIPALGAASSDAAALELMKAAVAEDVPSVIALLDPNEDAALHDYGQLIGDGSGDSGVTIDKATFTDTPVSGGVRVSLKSISITDPGDGQVSVDINGDCIETHSGGDDQKYCSADLFKELDRSDIVLTAAEKTALTDLFTALPNIGLVTTHVGGKWYVSPIRSVADIVPSVLSGLKGDDLLTLISLAQRSH